MAFTRRSSTYSVVKEATFGSAGVGTAKLITNVSGLGTGTAVLTANITGVAVGDVVYVYDSANLQVKYTARVTAVVSGTSVTVDDLAGVLSDAAVVANTSWMIQGTLLKIGDKTQFLDVTDFTVSPAVANITRNVIRQSFVNQESLMGEKTSSGNIAFELTPFEEDITGINGGLLIENAFGKAITGNTTGTPKATTIDGATSTTTNLTVLSTASFAVGQVIKVGSEYTTIKSITSATAMVVRPALSAAPAAATAVTALQTFMISEPTDTQYTLSVREHIGNVDDYVYSGVVANSISISLPTANIPVATVAVEGAGFAGGSNTAQDTLPALTEVPFVGRNADITVGGVTYCMRDVTIDVGSDVYSSRGLCSDGISNKTVTAKPTITVQGTLDYTGMDNFIAFQKGETGEFKLKLTNQEGKALYLYAPKAKRTNVAKGVDSMIITESVSLEFLDSQEVDYSDALIMGIGR
jgi:hypothetical protein